MVEWMKAVTLESIKLSILECQIVSDKNPNWMIQTVNWMDMKVTSHSGSTTCIYVAA